MSAVRFRPCAPDLPEKQALRESRRFARDAVERHYCLQSRPKTAPRRTEQRLPCARPRRGPGARRCARPSARRRAQAARRSSPNRLQRRASISRARPAQRGVLGGTCDAEGDDGEFAHGQAVGRAHRSWRVAGGLEWGRGDHAPSEAPALHPNCSERPSLPVPGRALPSTGCPQDLGERVGRVRASGMSPAWSRGWCRVEGLESGRLTWWSMSSTSSRHSRAFRPCERHRGRVATCRGRPVSAGGRRIRPLGRGACPLPVPNPSSLRA